jgi:hypothetical protein
VLLEDEHAMAIARERHRRTHAADARANHDGVPGHDRPPAPRVPNGTSRPHAVNACPQEVQGRIPMCERAQPRSQASRDGGLGEPRALAAFLKHPPKQLESWLRGVTANDEMQRVLAASDALPSLRALAVREATATTEAALRKRFGDALIVGEA